MNYSLLLLFALVILLAVTFLIFRLAGEVARVNDTLGRIAGAAERPAPAANGEGRENLTALRLQACERLTLMLERIAIPNLLLRTPPAPASSPKEYTATLLLAIREEFEYNVTQQIYVSDALWEVVGQARDNVSQLIVRAAEGADSAEQVASRLRLMSSRQPSDAVAVGQAALRREASLVLG